jgi:uncharacterized protein involved in type VI secretion and phage assembly
VSFLETAPRETSLEAGGFVKGLGIALVTQNKDPDKLCRVKVRYPWHDKPSESYWARLAMPMAGNDRGMVLIPEVGDECVVGWERGDLRFPCVLGVLWNGKDKTPYANADGNNEQRLFKSRDGHGWFFKDATPGSAEFKHKSGKHVLIDDDGLVFEDEKGNKLKIETKSGDMTIEAKGSLNIKASTITLQADQSITVKAATTLTLSGPQQVAIN